MTQFDFGGRAFSALLFDIDDTITTDGRLPAASYTALERLKAAGYLMIPVTGRPAGWCDMIARFWPIDAVVGENGAFYFKYDHKAKKLKKVYADGLCLKTAQAEHQQIEAIILEMFPEARISRDQPYRDIDIAFDFAEDIVPPMPMDEVVEMQKALENMGLTAKISSIHVNAWRGDHDKLATAKKLMWNEYQISQAKLKSDCLYVGDSPNDEPMFAFFDHSVGVQNVMDFWQQLKHKPRYVTQGRSGDGFVELSRILLEKKS
ncbi:MAG: HAD family hydrolase [Robiginitomaculum sp.]|nr:MAG: HAD family hydrolase [Robiginitomaculum sp.]